LLTAIVALALVTGQNNGPLAPRLLLLGPCFLLLGPLRVTLLAAASVRPVFHLSYAGLDLVAQLWVALLRQPGLVVRARATVVVGALLVGLGRLVCHCRASARGGAVTFLRRARRAVRPLILVPAALTQMVMLTVVSFWHSRGSLKAWI